MDEDPIPDKVKRFISLFVPSVPYLEALLLLRSDATKSWGYEEISQRLYLSEHAAQALLDELLAGGALVIDEKAPLQYRYQPKTEDLRQMVDLLGAIYAQNLVGVTNLIHSKVNKKAQQFAAAFRWRKDR